MSARSWLFVPGDSERKLSRAAESAADALILDLEDSVAGERRSQARVLVAEHLRARRGPTSQELWVRVNGLASGELLADLVGVVPAAPHGIVVPKLASFAELETIHHYLSALELREGLVRGTVRLVAIATETPQALLQMSALASGAAEHREGVRGRLAGLTWGAEDLAAAVGAQAKTDAGGSLTPLFELARSLCLLAAASAGVTAIDGVYSAFQDAAGLAKDLERARRDGFSGKLAIHPAQVAAINAAFSPSESELEHARRVLAAFAAAGNAGVASLDGRMIDRPHQLQAERLLSRVAPTPGAAKA